MTHRFAAAFVLLALPPLALAQTHPVSPAVGAAPPLVIVVDTSETPDLNGYAQDIQTLAFEWYPKIEAWLPSEGFFAPQRIEIEFADRTEGVAWTADDHVLCVAQWFRDRPQDRGAVIHELVHVAQHYTSGDEPGWLTEGIADYIRFYHFEPPERRPHPNPAKATYSDSYQTTAHFLDWAQQRYNPQLVLKLNAACRAGAYKDEIWTTLTGKTVEALGAEWKTSLRAK